MAISKSLVIGALLAIGGAAGSLHAQSARTPEATPAFDAVSITPGRGAMRAPLSMFPGGRVAARSITLRELIKQAYGSRRWPTSRIVGGPDWIGATPFDIEARAARDFGFPPWDGSWPDDLRRMLQRMLEDRFGVKVHPETREQDVYALVAVRPERPGAGLVTSTGACLGPFAAIAPMGREPGVTSARAPCPFIATPGRLQMGASTMDDVASVLSSFPAIGRVVEDRTGITGTYDFDLTFVPGFVPGARGGVVRNPQANGSASIFSALEQHLGLRLEAARGRVHVIVVDGADRPAMTGSALW